jgi:hypothetical protein
MAMARWLPAITAAELLCMLIKTAASTAQIWQLATLKYQLRLSLSDSAQSCC